MKGISKIFSCLFLTFILASYSSSCSTWSKQKETATDMIEVTQTEIVTPCWSGSKEKHPLNLTAIPSAYEEECILSYIFESDKEYKVITTYNYPQNISMIDFSYISETPIFLYKINEAEILFYDSIYFSTFKEKEALINYIGAGIWRPLTNFNTEELKRVVIGNKQTLILIAQDEEEARKLYFHEYDGHEYVFAIRIVIADEKITPDLVNVSANVERMLGSLTFSILNP